MPCPRWPPLPWSPRWIYELSLTSNWSQKHNGVGRTPKNQNCSTSNILVIVKLILEYIGCSWCSGATECWWSDAGAGRLLWGCTKIWSWNKHQVESVWIFAQKIHPSSVVAWNDWREPNVDGSGLTQYVSCGPVGNSACCGSWPGHKLTKLRLHEKALWLPQTH